MADLTKRAQDSQKGEWGRLAVFAGSTRYAGAAVLTVLGAQRTGVDRIQLYGVERAADAVLLASPETLSYPLDGHFLADAHLEEIPGLEGFTLVAGPGLTTQKATKKFLKKLLDDFDGPAVIDADGLRLLAELGPKSVKHLDRLVLTPNRYELALLRDEDSAEATSATVRETAEEWGAVVLCKGPTDFISDGTDTYEVSGGSPFLAKDGSGDVLTGIVGALLGRGLPPFEAAKLGAAIIKDAGERAAKAKGPSLVASDLPDFIDLRNVPEAS